MRKVAIFTIAVEIPEGQGTPAEYGTVYAIDTRDDGYLNNVLSSRVIVVQLNDEGALEVPWL